MGEKSLICNMTITTPTPSKEPLLFINISNMNSILLCLNISSSINGDIPLDCHWVTDFCYWGGSKTWILSPVLNVKLKTVKVGTLCLIDFSAMHCSAGLKVVRVISLVLIGNVCGGLAWVFLELVILRTATVFQHKNLPGSIMLRK